MQKQIEQALDKFGSLPKGNQEKMRAILKSYVDGEVGLDEAYYELLDQELIPMPQRCGMHSKMPDQDEEELKKRVRAELSL